MNAKYVSVWNCGSVVVETNCEFNPDTLEIGLVETAEHIPDVLESLDREYIIDSEENEYEVCTNCHEKILKTRMVEGVGKTLEEEKYCEDCD